MKLQFLGTGAAFSMKNYHPNLLIEENGKRLLVDAGGDIRFALRDVGLSSNDIDSVYITHLHNDHIGGMEYIAFTSYFNPNREKPRLFCHKILVEDLWSHSLKGGLQSVQGKVLNIYDYFNIISLDHEGTFEWEGVKLELRSSIHVFNGYSTIPTFGLMMTPKSGIKVYLTSDTQFTPDHLMPRYLKADIIIQDCETSPFRSEVHAHYDDLKTLPADIKAKMLLWHYQDNVVDKFDEWQEKAKKDGFKKFIIKGEIFDYSV
jgi:ribonuclease BN (tRNA processing enzyme)